MTEKKSEKTNEKPKSREKTVTLPQLRYLYNLEKRKLRQLLQRQRTIVQLFAETNAAEEAINAIHQNEKIQGIIPLGAGIFVEGTLSGKKLHRNLPGEVILPSTAEEVKSDLSERRKIFDEELKGLGKEIETVAHNLRGMERVIELLRAQRKKTR